MAKRQSKPKTGVPGTCGSCNRERTIVARGLCRTCYMKQRRTGQRAIEILTRKATELEHVAEKALNAAAEAKQVLESALPDAARYLVKAARIAAEKGNSRPAEVILREVPIGPNTDDRLLRSQFSAGQRDTSETGGRVQVLIGVQLGGSKVPEIGAKPVRQLEAAADANLQVIEAQTVTVKDERL